MVAVAHLEKIVRETQVDRPRIDPVGGGISQAERDQMLELALQSWFAKVVELRRLALGGLAAMPAEYQPNLKLATPENVAELVTRIVAQGAEPNTATAKAIPTDKDEVALVVVDYGGPTDVNDQVYFTFPLAAALDALADPDEMERDLRRLLGLADG